MTTPGGSGKSEPSKTEKAPGAAPADRTVALPGIQEALANVPPEQRQIIERSLSMMFMQGPFVNPILHKVDGQHITQVIDSIDKESQRDHEDRREHRKHLKHMVIIGAVAFAGISGLFLYFQQSSLLGQLITLLVAISGGIGIGVGYKRYREEEE